MQASADRSAVAMAGRGIAVVGIALLVVGLLPFDARLAAAPAWMGAPVGSEVWPAMLLAGLALVIAGLVALVVGHRAPVSCLTALIGLVVLATRDTNTAPAASLSASLAGAMQPWLVPLVLLLVLGVAGVRYRSGFTPLAIGVLLVATAVVSVLRAATYDPFFEPACTCGHGSPFIVADATLRGVLRLGDSLIAFVAALAVSLTGARALRRSDAYDRWSQAVIASGLAFGLVVLVTVLIVVAGGLRDVALPASVRSPTLATMYLALSASLLGMAAGVGASAATAIRARLRIRRLAGSIESAPTPASLQQALGAALGDAELRIGYWVPAAGWYVEGDGEPVAVTAPPDVGTTFIERGGSPLAMIRHRPLLDDAAISREFRPGMLLALDNARLRAAGLAHLRELHVSRTRVVEVGDRERRRIERDLHDGAQQGLLALAFDLRVARLEAQRHGDEVRAARLASAETMAIDAGEELRRVARGTHPAVLSQAGLAVALASLTDETPIPLIIEANDLPRLPEIVEAIAYRMVVEALADAVRRGAESLTVGLSIDGDRLLVDLADDAPPPETVPLRLIDRVGAGGGDLELIRRPHVGGTLLRAALPCA